jgi:hypothetical protein
MNTDFDVNREPVEKFEDLINELKIYEEKDYVYRAQMKNWPLQSSLERAYDQWVINDPKERQCIEENMIRDFQRVYNGDDRSVVQSDILYCMSLMRHYLAPSRLLDCTRSIYVAAYFAIEYACDNPPLNEETKEPDYNESREVVVWCFDIEVLNKAAKLSVDYPKFKTHYRKRFIDDERDDKSFYPLYMKNKYDLVVHENPMTMHRRLHLQQGAFLCPGNINKSFKENLEFIPKNMRYKAVKNIIWKTNPNGLKDAANNCLRMNMTRESLFPGLDGYALSTKYQLDFYNRLGKARKRYGMRWKP